MFRPRQADASEAGFKSEVLSTACPSPGPSSQREAVSFEAVPRFEVGGGATTPVSLRIIPSDLLKT